MSDQLSTRLDPEAIESPLYAAWKQAGYFHVPAERVLQEGAEPFVIVIPPPNVTAVLHMGHGLNNTIQDVLIRWRRMQGRAAEWLPGTDHAGIATQNVVERLIADEGLTRDDLGREAFVERVWDYVNETGGTILEQLEAIGCSCDWERTAFTLDPGLSRAVREVFVRLYHKGLIYRGEYIINWCPRCHTALSNEEAEGEETPGRLYHLRYPLRESAWDAARQASEAGADAVGQLDTGGWYLTVSSTRPETMLGDTAVAVNPDDERYRALVGSSVDLPLTGRTIPIVADPHVDAEFGTGMVKVTPAHDPNDFEIARRTGAEVLNVMTEAATLNENAPEPFQGMERLEAREAVLTALDAEGLLAGSDEHTHSVPHCYRCHTVVEPRLSEQWFVKMAPLAKPALQASRDGTVRFTPERWQKVYEHWLENIRDWCISRQLWWGHRIPVWYCGCGETLVAVTDPDSCPRCGASELEQDPDVLDTWFSSQLWPFSTFGWPDDTDDLQAFYPGHVLSTAPEILFFWVARMIMIGYEVLGEAPFRDVYLHGTVRDTQGRKMSKSLGNGIDPLEVVNLFGADALRWTLISSAGVGTDLYLDPADLEASFSTGRNFANKLWNAGRFTLTSVGTEPVKPLSDALGDLELEDRWILSRLARATRETTRHLERFRLHDVAETLYHFFWGEFADWYLELVKGRLREDAVPSSREAARSTLVAAFDGICRLLHPLIPFVTEELWSRLPWPRDTDRPEALIVAPWPEAEASLLNPDAEEQFAALQELVTQVRSLRKEYGVAEGREVSLVLSGLPASFESTLGGQADALRRLARVGSAETAAVPAHGIGAHAVLENGTEVFLPLEGVIDVDRELARLGDEIGRLEEQAGQAERMLANERFVERAPGEVVDREREKVRTAREQIAKLEAKRARLAGG